MCVCVCGKLEVNQKYKSSSRVLLKILVHQSTPGNTVCNSHVPFSIYSQLLSG